jgi:formylglycine-generating enzyme required for sulfatase activity/tRNA A-37 threonylcarbamoyl transferase component Bud32
VPTTPSTDHNLIFGLLALQMDFVTREQLLDGMNAWMLQKSRPLGQVLHERGVLSTRLVALLQELVQEHIDQHDDNPQASLAALRVEGPLFQDLESLPDDDLHSRLAFLAATPSPGDIPPASHDTRGEEPDSPPTRSPPPDEHAGPPIPDGMRYLRLVELNNGGWGVVFLARDRELGREVVLKEIMPGYSRHPVARTRFLREAEVTSQLEHPSIVPVYDRGDYPDGRPFYVMRYIKEESLQEAIHRFHSAGRQRRSDAERSLELRRLLRHFLDVCHAMEYAHKRGVIHRDLKPGNIMLGKFGETQVVDWGLAKILGKADAPATEGVLIDSDDPALTEVGQMLGTLPYMSPEQATGNQDQVGPASDIYSLGATLYCLLTGRPPFVDKSRPVVEEMVKKGDFPPPRRINPSVPAGLEAVCLKAMARAPADRYASVGEVAEEIDRWLADEPVRALPEPWPVRAGRWARRRPALTAGGAALLFTAVMAVAIAGPLLREQQRQARQAKVDTLLDVAPSGVQKARDELAELPRDEVRSLLRRVVEKPRPASATAEAVRLWRQHRARAALALLEEDSGQIELLTGRLLEEDLAPAEMFLFRDALASHAEQLMAGLWQHANEGPPARCFRALVALAKFDPDSTNWEKAAAKAVGELVSTNSLYLGQWAEALEGVSQHLRGPLARVFRGEDKAPAAHRQAAAKVLARYAADDLDLLAGLLLDADEQQSAVLFPKLEAHRDKAKSWLRRRLAPPLDSSKQPDWNEPQPAPALARRRGTAGALLLRLGESAPVQEMFRRSADPTARSWLVERVGSRRVDPRLLVERLQVEQDASARAALIVALGDYSDKDLPNSLRDPLVKKLLGWYRDDPDPGLHGAVDWLLRHGQEGPSPRPLDWRQVKELERIDGELKRRDPDGKHGWFVNGKGQTFALIKAPGVFRMGSSPREPGRFPNEKPHWRKIDHNFAIAVKPITVAQWMQFVKAPSFARRYSPEPDGPMISLSWFDAARYCNWLSEQEGIPKEQWCYPDEIGEGMKPFPDYLKRTGYRLPTEAEWEYACRAGAITERYYGAGAELLPRYAFFMDNSANRAWPVGQKRPNDLGLFDMHGNVWTWCQPVADWKDKKSGVVEDRESVEVISGVKSCPMRGCGFDVPAPNVRSADRFNHPAGKHYYTHGLRVARTCP